VSALAGKEISFRRLLFLHFSSFRCRGPAIAPHGIEL
jgi:hypothetical protein